MGMIYLIRHGQASFLKENYDQLSALGITQSKTLGKALKERNACDSLVEGGSMVRHRETASHCFSGLERSLDFTENSQWNEYNHTELLALHNPELSDFDAMKDFIVKQSNPMKSLQQLLNNSIQDWMEDKHDYTVSFADFKHRVWNALNELGERLNKDQRAWVFTSGGPIAAIVIQLLKLQEAQFMDLQARLVNTSITKVVVGKNRLSLSTYNDYSHLDHQPDWITFR